MSERVEEIQKRFTQIERVPNRTGERFIMTADVPWMIARILELEEENKALKIMVLTDTSE